jgi:hypothetical protein
MAIGAEADSGKKLKRTQRDVLRTADGFIGLVLIPFTDALVSSSWYAALPLYILQLEYSLATLGVVSGVVPVIRISVPILGAHFLPGRLEILKMPLQTQCIATGVFNLIFPTSELAIYWHLYSIIMLMQRSMYQAIAVRVFSEDRKSALRVAESCHTVGYCLGSLWSGAAYHYGSWVAVVLVQVAMLATTVLLEAIFLPQLRPTCRGFRQISQPEPSPEVASLSTADQVCPEDGAQADLPEERPNRLEQKQRDFLCYFVCVGMFLFVFGYAVEWGVYSVYLSKKFGFSTLTMGAGQMAGDMGGAVLLLSTTSKPLMTRALRQTEERQGREPWYDRLGLFRLPFGLIWIALLYAVSFFTFAADDKNVAMGSQVIMGTLFVLSVQAVNELLLWLSWRGSETAEDGAKVDAGGCRGKQYQRFLAMSDVAYSSAVSLGNFAPFLLLDTAPHLVDWLLYWCGIGIAVYTVLFTALFAADQRNLEQAQAQQGKKIARAASAAI